MYGICIFDFTGCNGIFVRLLIIITLIHLFPFTRTPEFPVPLELQFDFPYHW